MDETIISNPFPAKEPEVPDVEQEPADGGGEVPSNPEPVPVKKSKTGLIIGVVAVLVACCCLIPVCVIAVLSLMGSSINDTFEEISGSLVTPEAIINDLPPIELPTSAAGQNPGEDYSDIILPGRVPYMPQFNTMGDPTAPVVIIEYSDFQCPYCMYYWQDTEWQIIDEYVSTGKVYLIYNSMGNFISDWADTANTESQDAAMAAHCAGEQQKYWEYHDVLFANWNGENEGNLTSERLKRFAGALGLDQGAFDDCLDSQRYFDTVKQELEAAKSAGVSGTPSFLVNGQFVEGAQPFEEFKKIIDQELLK